MGLNRLAVSDGYRSGWICPSCSKVLWKPPTLVRGDRFHSTDCREPMLLCRVLWSRPERAS